MAVVRGPSKKGHKSKLIYQQRRYPFLRVIRPLRSCSVISSRLTISSSLLPGIEPQPCKKLEPSPERLLAVLQLLAGALAGGAWGRGARDPSLECRGIAGTSPGENRPARHRVADRNRQSGRCRRGPDRRGRKRSTYRSSSDSPLEGNGFELPVRGPRWRYCSPRRRRRNRWFADSLCCTKMDSTRLRTPARRPCSYGPSASTPR
jgi:hypothetical protein